MSDAKQYAKFDTQKLANIPEALKALNQWVCWRLQKIANKDRWAKVPVNPKTGREASVQDSRTWASFNQAVGACNVNPALQGVGFVFTPTDLFCGIDIDDCRDRESKQIGDWAEVIVKTLDSYTEVSPSGTGVKIICIAQPPGTAARRNKIEIYSQARYFTITGEHLTGTPVTVNERQDELTQVYKTVFGDVEATTDDKAVAAAQVVVDAKLERVRQISDEDLLKKAREAANGEKFTRLFEGSAEEYGGDHSRADAALCSILCFWTRCDRDRIDRLFRASALFRKKWEERRGNQLYGELTIAHAIGSATALYDPDLDANLSARHNDIANAEIFIQQSGDKYRWCGSWKSWLKWDGAYWEKDAEAEVRRSVEDVSHELIRRAQTLPADEQRRELKWAIDAGNVSRLNAIETVAKARLNVSASLFDKDPYLLCCKNGVVDLRTGELLTPTQDQWMTRSTHIAFNKKAMCARWNLFMSEIMQGDKEMVDYLWRVIGYTLTGLTTERAFFILHGGGRNGKSTFVETIRAMMGSYAQKSRFTTFLKKGVNNSGANDDIAHLLGARLVSASEADASTPLDVSLVKELTGSDTVRARHLYGREFEFLPQFKLFFATNHIPPIYESTFSIWDRLHYIGFNYRVPESGMDRSLGIHLLGELEGILARAVKGCQEWREGGLQPPAKVLASREELHQSFDMIGQFFNERINWLPIENGADHTAKLKHGYVYDEFGKWAKANGFRHYPSSRSLSSWLKEHGVSGAHSMNGLVWLDLEMRETSSMF